LVRAAVAALYDAEEVLRDVLKFYDDLAGMEWA